jgi:hypothetical protein
MLPIAWGKAPELSTEQKHHENDDDNKAKSASTDVVDVGQHGRYEEVHAIPFSVDGNTHGLVRF